MTAGSDEMIQQNPFPDSGKVTAAVVTGDHPFDVVGFHNMLRGLAEVDAYVQHLQDFVVDWGKARTKYDVVLFYNFHQETPPDKGTGRGWFGRTREALEELGETEQGIVVLHHAFNAFLHWDFWARLVGIPYSDRLCPWDVMGAGCSFDDVRHMIADPAHPITQGLSAWDMYGELWDFGSSTLEPDCHAILVTDHPKMRLKSTAWTHKFKRARVFCLQPGHDKKIYADPNFRTVLSRGIQWAARRL
jgi:hypothetical protein